MPIRTFLLTKLMLLLMIPVLLTLPFIFIYKDNQIVLTVLTIIVVVFISLPYIGTYSRKYFVYEEYIVVQSFFKKEAINFNDIESIHELDNGFELTFKNGIKAQFIHKGMFKRDRKQLFLLLERLVTKPEFPTL